MQAQVSDIKNIVENQLGKKLLCPKWYDNIYLWLNWYKGKVDAFHEYEQYNGHEWVQRTRYTLQMPKVIAEDWATLLYNDRTAIKVDSEAEQATLNKILESNRFESKFSNLLEMVMALGIGATVEYKDKDGEPKINYIIAPMVFPLRVENGEIVDCVFASVVNKQYYINVHEKQDSGRYKISNYYYSFDSSANDFIKKDRKGVKETYYSDHKLFQIYKPCIVNNVDLFAPFGISVFANALDRVKTVDLIYDSLRNEFVLGKKRLFLREDLLENKPFVRSDGSTINIPTFDNNDVEFYSLPTDEGAGEQIKEINPSLRISEHIEALQSALNMLSDVCGLGNERYTFKEGKTYTNTTQVISTQSKLYKTLLKHEKELRASMVEMIKALMYLKTNREYEEDITIDFDDSIIEDSEAIQKRALQELGAGIIDQVEYVMQVYKYTKDQAEEFVKDVTERTLERQRQMAQLEPTLEDGSGEEQPTGDGANEE